MDNLTHGLFGLAIGALRRPDGGRGMAQTASPTDKAVLLGAVIAAELPDLDAFWPAENEVLHALHAHRGISHALLIAPVWALVATLVARLVFRKARSLPVYSFAVLAVVAAHLLPDLWTGWGTRALLPFSDVRVSWDITSVVDPLVTLPLLVGAIWAVAQRRHWRKAILVGFAVACLYLGFRTVSRALLLERVASQYPEATRVEVFPAILSATEWRYVATLPESHAAGVVSAFGSPKEQKRHPLTFDLPPRLAQTPTVDEALAWARLPLVSTVAKEDGDAEVHVADLRYHLGGMPTLTIVVDVARDGEVKAARLDRGGSAKELLERWRGADGAR